MPKVVDQSAWWNPLLTSLALSTLECLPLRRAFEFGCTIHNKVLCKQRRL